MLASTNIWKYLENPKKSPKSTGFPFGYRCDSKWLWGLLGINNSCYQLPWPLLINLACGLSIVEKKQQLSCIMWNNIANGAMLSCVSTSMDWIGQFHLGQPALSKQFTLGSYSGDLDGRLEGTRRCSWADKALAWGTLVSGRKGEESQGHVP